MGRPKQGPRIRRHYDTPSDRESKTDNFQWAIRDGSTFRRTGLRGEGSRQAAEAALGRYLVERGIPVQEEQPGLVYVMDLVDLYCELRADEVADPDRLDYAAEALATFWAGKTVEDVNEQTCKAYVKHRTDAGRSRSTARRELTALRAALNKSRDRLAKVPTIWLPKETPARTDYLTRDEFAAVLWQLRMAKKTRHAARLVLCYWYTGSRSKTVAMSKWGKTDDGPWIDLKERIWYRRGDDERETNKAREPHTIPRRLFAHLERWHRLFPELEYVVEHPRNPGKPVLDIGKALETACDKAGVERTTTHGLKRAAITNFIRGGGSVEEAVEYYSTTAETIRKNYWQFSPRYQAKTAAQVDRLGRSDTDQKPPKMSANQ